ncbi:MAG: cysteine desulfurase family protein [Patescibacteria group bacterium]
MKRIFLDHAATTPLEKDVKKVMDVYAMKHFGNPSSLHKEGVIGRQAVLAARIEAARFSGALPEEIIFTGSGTEANNIAISGVFEELLRNGISLRECHAVTSVIEHPSVLRVFQALERKGLSVTYVGVNSGGAISCKEIKEALRKNTKLVSIMHANNEIGTIEPIHEIAKTVRHFREKQGSIYPLVHTDACQTLNCSLQSVQSLGVDMLSASAQKIYGPKGVGMLYVKNGTPIAPLLYGGGQEKGLRPGTENVAGIVGFARALSITEKLREKECLRLTKLRIHFLARLKALFPECVINGDTKEQVPHIVNVSFPGTDQEELVLRLDAKGIAVGARSACGERHEDVSYCVQALGPGHYPEAAVRFSMGRGTGRQDIDHTLKALKEIFSKIIQRT